MIAVLLALCCATALVTAIPIAAPTNNHLTTPQESTWVQLANGPWSAREGLMAVTAPEGIYLSGGRDRFGATAIRDVWFSSNGSTWTQMPLPPWVARSYHAMFYQNGCIVVAGGQKVSFVGNPYFNDVWKSCDGAKTWQSLGNAPWTTRAGIAFTEFDGKMIVAGGCYGESGPSGQGRKFLNDVWASADGSQWELITANASWSARSGARLVVFGGKLFLVAGEVGFTPDTQDGDIWTSVDGKDWILLTPTPGWSKRSGHGVVVAGNELLVIAGWNNNKCLHDLWSSTDGRSWSLRSNSTWGCSSDSCGKFDFWSLVANSSLITLGGSSGYSTFGKMNSDTSALPLPLDTAATSM